MAIEWIDSPQDLFSLLTVSKEVFPIAARCLYRDPIKNFTCPHDEKLPDLVRFLLSLSPASGKNIDIIRQSNDLPLSGTSDPKPMLDYLSLVKAIRWKFRLIGADPLCSALRYPNNDVYRQLTWAFVGHRLDQVEELEIDVEDQERYINNASKMTRLRKVWIHIGEDFSYKNMYDCAEAIIRAIQLHHGPDQVSECHMVPSPLEWGTHTYDNNHSSYRIDLSGAQRILSLLPPPKHYLTLPRPDGSVISLNHSFDPYLATIEKMACIDSVEFRFMWMALMKLHPGHSHAQILQRFRGMTSLEIGSETANGNDENLLAWAACEAEHYYHQPGGRRHLGSLVPLEDLNIMYETPFCLITPPPPPRTATPKWKILQDGLLGFSATLKRLHVTYPQSENRMADRLFTIPRPMHKLKSLLLRGLAIDRSVWDQAPNIETLLLDVSFPPLRDGFAVPSFSLVDQTTGMLLFSPISVDTTTTTATATETTILTTEGQPQQQLPEIWFHCPKLTDLMISDQAFSFLNPECLLLSPNLKSLDVFPSSMTYKSYKRVDSSQSQKAPRVIYPTRLTWDWFSPMLHHVRLSGNFHEFRFSMALLRACPILSCIDLDHGDANQHFPLRVRGILDASLDKNHQMLPFTHNNLQKIIFRGYWIIEVDELACLLRVLSGLKEIEFNLNHYDDSFGDRELVEVTKTHPSLKCVNTNMKRTTEPPSALGLSHMNWNVASKTPKEHPRIVYLFEPLDYYAFYV